MTDGVSLKGVLCYYIPSSVLGVYRKPYMGDLTKNFSLWEFECKDGTPVPVKYIPNVRMLARHLQQVRTFTGQPMRINSGFRTKTHNDFVGGEDNSEHLTGNGADIESTGLGAKQLGLIFEGLIRLDVIPDGELGVYIDGHIHYAPGTARKRWEK